MGWRVAGTPLRGDGHSCWGALRAPEVCGYPGGRVTPTATNAQGRWSVAGGGWKARRQAAAQKRS